jgi:NAD(P)H-hydrate epimerase
MRSWHGLRLCDSAPVAGQSPAYNGRVESPSLTRDQCRALDRRAVEEYGIPSLVLMENAGRGCVDVLEQLGIGGSVVIFCGKGNNAGDGFVIARHLDVRGHDCRVLLVGRPNELAGDAATNFAILQKTGAAIEQFDPANQRPADAAWLVDALLGTGALGEPRPPFDMAIDWINRRRSKTQVLAVDVPSGLDCDTGEPARHTVRADHTCTFVAMKVGFTNLVAKSFCGTVHVCDIGVPRRLIDELSRR